MISGTMLVTSAALSRSFWYSDGCSHSSRDPPLMELRVVSHSCFNRPILLVLSFRHPNHQSIQSAGNGDLARQARIRLGDSGKAQHTGFLRSCRR
jgi:hypothetical protein